MPHFETGLAAFLLFCMTLRSRKSLCRQQFFRVRERIAGDFAAAEQASQLLQTRTFIQRLHVRLSHFAVGFFADYKVVVATARDLR